MCGVIWPGPSRLPWSGWAGSGRIGPPPPIPPAHRANPTPKASQAGTCGRRHGARILAVAGSLLLRGNLPRARAPAAKALHDARRAPRARPSATASRDRSRKGLACRRSTSRKAPSSSEDPSRSYRRPGPIWSRAISGSVETISQRIICAFGRVQCASVTVLRHAAPCGWRVLLRPPSPHPSAAPRTSGNWTTPPRRTLAWRPLCCEENLDVEEILQLLGQSAVGPLDRERAGHAGDFRKRASFREMVGPAADAGRRSAALAGNAASRGGGLDLPALEGEQGGDQGLALDFGELRRSAAERNERASMSCFLPFFGPPRSESRSLRIPAIVARSALRRKSASAPCFPVAARECPHGDRRPYRSDRRRRP